MAVEKSKEFFWLKGKACFFWTIFLSSHDDKSEWQWYTVLDELMCSLASPIFLEIFTLQILDFIYYVFQMASQTRLSYGMCHTNTLNRSKKVSQANNLKIWSLIRKNILKFIGTPPSEIRDTHLTVTHDTHCHPGHSHPDLPIKHTWRTFYIRTASRKSKRRLQSINIRTASINAFAPQYIRITNMGYPDMIVRIID